MQKPKLRDSKRLHSDEPYELNKFPPKLIREIGSFFVYLIYVGRKDISGTDWGDAFAAAINGTHFDSPLGIADVELGQIAWSLKTVKNPNPVECKNIRLISDRCSPDYSYGITDPHKDVQKTGTAVLSIWNERVNVATDKYSQVRTATLVRSYDLLSYCLFEQETRRYKTSDYVWQVNPNGNLIGKDLNGRHCFTWQPHGSQFTIHEEVPESAVKFKIKEPPKLERKAILKSIQFDSSWVTIL